MSDTGTTCQGCGTPYNPGTLFCTSCGLPVASATSGAGGGPGTRTLLAPGKKRPAGNTAPAGNPQWRPGQDWIPPQPGRQGYGQQGAQPGYGPTGTGPGAPPGGSNAANVSQSTAGSASGPTAPARSSPAAPSTPAATPSSGQSGSRQQATADKNAFVGLWNPIAGQYSLPQYTGDQI